MAKKSVKKKSKKDIEDKKTEEAEEKPVSKKQIKSENKILRNFLIILGFFVILILIIIFMVSSAGEFEYRGVDFQVEKFCDAGPCLTVYRTAFPVLIEGEDISVVDDSRKNANYNIYIRNDPRQLEREVPFNGELNLRNLVVINQTKDFHCEGYGAIAIDNFLKQRIFNMEIISDPNATADNDGDYLFVNIQEGSQTSVEQIGESSYNINIKDCEILEGTERFMIETFVQVNEILN